MVCIQFGLHSLLYRVHMLNMRMNHYLMSMYCLHIFDIHFQEENRNSRDIQYSWFDWDLMFYHIHKVYMMLLHLLLYIHLTDSLDMLNHQTSIDQVHINHKLYE